MTSPNVDFVVMKSPAPQIPSEAASQKPVAGFLLSLVAAGLWGILPIALKELLAGMDATTIVWYRFFAAGLVLTAWLAVKGNLPNLVEAAPSVRWILIIAALGLCANYSLFSQSLNYVNGETSEAVIQLTTLFLIFGGVIFYKEPFDGIQKLGTVLIVVGLILFFHDRLASFGSFENQETIGVLIVFVAAVTWTVYALLQKKLLKSFSSVQILFLIYAFSVAVLLPFVSPAKLFQLSSFELALLGFCCINTLIAYGCFAEALNLWDASKVSAVLALAPLFTIGTLKLIVFFDPGYAFSDRLTIISLMGAAFLVIGSVLAALMPVIKYKIREKYR
jgi:drug/metabolite transporter (DMT)-like permease